MLLLFAFPSFCKFVVNWGLCACSLAEIRGPFRSKYSSPCARFLSGRVASTASWLSFGRSAILLMRHKYLRLCFRAQKHVILYEGFSCSPYRYSPSLITCLTLFFSWTYCPVFWQTPGWAGVRKPFLLSPLSRVNSDSVEIVGIYSSVVMDAGKPPSRWMDVWPLKTGRKSVGMWWSRLNMSNTRPKSDRH